MFKKIWPYLFMILFATALVVSGVRIQHLAETNRELVKINVGLTKKFVEEVNRNKSLAADKASFEQALYAPMPLWQATAMYDGMIAANGNSQYGNWEYNLSDALAPALYDMAADKEGKPMVRQRLATLRPRVMRAVKAGYGWGWEEDLLDELQKAAQ